MIESYGLIELVGTFAAGVALGAGAKAVYRIKEHYATRHYGETDERD